MNRFKERLFIFLAIGAALIGISCRLSNELSQLRNLASPAEQNISTTPSTSDEIQATGEYPGPISGLPQTLYPYPSQPEILIPLMTVYPGPTDSPAYNSPAYPAVDENYDLGSPYPDIGEPSSTPVRITPTPVLQTTNELYPGPLTLTPTLMMRTPTGTGGVNGYPGPVTSTPVFALTPTPSATLVIASTFTPNPTQTFTPTPTPTRTLPPLPPWLDSGLVATDPDTVKLASGNVQLVWFFAFWDGPSQALASLIHGLEDQYEERMNFIYMDIDDPRTQDLKEILGYRFQPHFFLLDRNGVILQQWFGDISVQMIQRSIEAVLN